MSPKGDDTVYVVFKELKTIKEIHWRAAQIQNPAIGIRNYIPPQFWRRYMYLNEECNKYRQHYKNTKTQLRFNNLDIEILVKTRGSTEPYSTVPYDEITDPKYIPKFEYNIKWENRNDSRPLRKKIIPFRDNTEVSDRMEEDDSQNVMTRQRSTDSKSGKADSKKQKLDASSSSSGSDSDI